jgi:hypothetical protein
VMDRGYLDFERLYALHQAPASFVIRSKSNTDLRRVYSNPVDKSSGVLCDQIVALEGFYTRQGYPEKLRRIKFYDSKRDKQLTFLTNQFLLPAATIADLSGGSAQLGRKICFLSEALPGSYQAA